VLDTVTLIGLLGGARRPARRSWNWVQHRAYTPRVEERQHIMLLSTVNRAELVRGRAEVGGCMAGVIEAGSDYGDRWAAKHEAQSLNVAKDIIVKRNLTKEIGVLQEETGQAPGTARRAYDQN